MACRLAVLPLLLFRAESLRLERAAPTERFDIGDLCPPGSDCPSISSAYTRSGGAPGATWETLTFLEEDSPLDKPVPEEASPKNDMVARARSLPEPFPESELVRPGSLRHENTDRMFMAIFTSPRYADRRAAVREAWPFSRHVKYRFVVCDHDTDFLNHDDVQARLHLLKEQQRYNDIMLLLCEEGYQSGKLTRKTIAAMRAYHDWFPGVPFFFKVDDDTYPQVDKLLHMVESQPKGYLYAGLRYNGGGVERDKSKPFYDIYKESSYPPSMAGGPGYVLSAPLVNFLLRRGIELREVPSYMEDKALGIWIDQFGELKNNTIWLRVPGTDGYGVDMCKLMKKELLFQKESSIILHHKLSPATIRCMGLGMRHGIAKPDLSCFCKSNPPAAL